MNLFIVSLMSLDELDRLALQCTEDVLAQYYWVLWRYLLLLVSGIIWVLYRSTPTDRPLLQWATGVA